jgi:geranylgeranyl pyrophosphate synthase
VAESFGTTPSNESFSLCCTVELIHKASLIQDDLMDNTDTRSGRDAVHVFFGPAMAVLISDYLLAMACGLLKQDPFNFLRLQQAVTSAIQATVIGQARELKLKRDKVQPNASELRAIRRNKTGALYGLATFIGGVMAGVSDEELSRLQDWGVSLGEANDDLMDCETLAGDEARLLELKEILITSKPGLKDLANWIIAS